MLVQVFECHRDAVGYNLDITIVSDKRSWTCDEVMNVIAEWAEDVEKKLHEVHGDRLRHPSTYYKDLSFFLEELGRRKVYLTSIPENTYGYNGNNLGEFKSRGEKIYRLYVDWGSPFRHFYICNLYKELEGKTRCNIIAVSHVYDHTISILAELWNADDLYAYAEKNFTEEDYEKALSPQLYTKVMDYVKQPYRKYLVAADYRGKH